MILCLRRVSFLQRTIRNLLIELSTTVLLNTMYCILIRATCIKREISSSDCSFARFSQFRVEMPDVSKLFGCASNVLSFGFSCVPVFLDHGISYIKTKLRYEKVKTKVIRVTGLGGL